MTKFCFCFRIPVLQFQPLFQPAQHSSIYAVSPVIVPYAAGTPLKLLFSQFPPRVEALVQRVQNYFSHYNYPHLIPIPQLPPSTAGTVPAGSDSTSASGLPSTTTPAPTSTTTTSTTTSTAAAAATTTATATATATQQPPATPIDNSASTGGLDFELPPSTDSQGAGYRYDPPSRNKFNYPIQPRFQQQQRKGYFYRR